MQQEREEEGRGGAQASQAVGPAAMEQPGGQASAPSQQGLAEGGQHTQAAAQAADPARRGAAPEREPTASAAAAEPLQQHHDAPEQDMEGGSAASGGHDAAGDVGVAVEQQVTLGLDALALEAADSAGPQQGAGGAVPQSVYGHYRLKKVRSRRTVPCPPPTAGAAAAPAPDAAFREARPRACGWAALPLGGSTPHAAWLSVRWRPQRPDEGGGRAVAARREVLLCACARTCAGGARRCSSAPRACCTSPGTWWRSRWTCPPCWPRACKWRCAGGTRGRRHRAAGPAGLGGDAVPAAAAGRHAAGLGGPARWAPPPRARRGDDGACAQRG